MFLNLGQNHAFFFFKHLTTLNYHVKLYGVGRPLKLALEVILLSDTTLLSLENSALNSGKC